MQLDGLIDSLPQHPPFRFVDTILEYHPRSHLKASFSSLHLHSSFRGQRQFPSMCIVEGLAQTAILFVQLETSPLEKDEFPVLGSMSISKLSSVDWEEVITYKVYPVALFSLHGMIGVEAAVAGETVVKGELTLARKKMKVGLQA